MGGHDIRVKPRITEQVERLWLEHTHGADLVIGVHFRGTDTSLHFPFHRAD